MRRGLLLATLLLTACSTTSPSEGPAPPAPQPREVRIDFPERDFVPQGLALDDDGTAWISGYVDAPVGERACQVAHVDRRTGELLEFVREISQSGVPFCRHGGGIALDERGLWVAGAARLWLLGPGTLDVTQSWTVDPAIRASAITVDGDELVVAVWREHRRGEVMRYPIADLLGATTLDRRDARRIPSRVQGVVVRDGRTWLARSTSYCGELVTPGGRHLDLVAGAEGIAFDDADRLWVVSESGSPAYQRKGGRPDVPTLTRLDVDDLRAAGSTGCGW